jgi:hypothetical protein
MLGMNLPANAEDALQQARACWDRWQRSQPANHAQYTDWGDNPTVFRGVMRHSLGCETENFFTFLKKTTLSAQLATHSVFVVVMVVLKGNCWRREFFLESQFWNFPQSISHKGLHWRRSKALGLLISCKKM